MPLLRPAVAVIGRKRTGKTTTVEKLVRKLVSEGFNVSTLKHTIENFDIDYVGTDSYRHRQAGAIFVALQGRLRSAIIVEREIPFERLLEYASLFGDVIVLEGFSKLTLKDPRIGKIICVKDEAGKGEYREAVNVLCYSVNGVFDIEKVVSWLKEQIKVFDIYRKTPMIDCKLCGYDSCYEFSRAVACELESIEKCPMMDVRVYVDGRGIPLTRYPASVIRDVTMAMLSTLKGVGSLEGKMVKIYVE